MPYDDDDLIRNGTLRQLLNYRLKNTPIRSWYITTVVAVLAFWLGTHF